MEKHSKTWLNDGESTARYGTKHQARTVDFIKYARDSNLQTPPKKTPPHREPFHVPPSVRVTVCMSDIALSTCMC